MNLTIIGNCSYTCSYKDIPLKVRSLHLEIKSRLENFEQKPSAQSRML